MRKCKITVWDYTDAVHGGRYIPKDWKPVKYEVEAWCVQGETGFRAYFYTDDGFCEAHGDDGHWWLVGRCHKHWVKEIKEVINAVDIDSAGSSEE